MENCFKASGKIDAYKKSIKTVKEEDPIDKIVEKERSKQADRRFNIQENGYLSISLP
ncbi:MAG: hypothetical protein HWD61_04565 [Parachlamydiaceae bacterium]|nr:MAG: hypothetical protein HWD61_04565 [Parachlamydiaceae bacterium]